MTIDDLTVSHSVALKLSQIAKLSDLAQRTDRNRSNLMQEAVDDLFVKYNQAEMMIQAISTLPHPADAEPVPVVQVASNPHVRPTD